jgi:hypothetical protein
MIAVRSHLSSRRSPPYKGLNFVGLCRFWVQNPLNSVFSLAQAFYAWVKGLVFPSSSPFRGGRCFLAPEGAYQAKKAANTSVPQA